MIQQEVNSDFVFGKGSNFVLLGIINGHGDFGAFLTRKCTKLIY